MGRDAGEKMRRTPRKADQRRIVVLLVIDLLAIVFTLLQAAGLLSVSDIMIRLGLEDKPAVNAETEVHFIDVGQADCTLVLSQGKAMLIDSGDMDRTDKVMQYLLDHGVRKLDAVIVTHPHSDHMGEMSDIIGRFEIGTFYMPAFPEELTPATYSYEKMLDALDKKDMGITDPDGKTFDLGSCKVQIYTAKDEYDDLNEYSAVVRITDGGNTFLVTGDCGFAEERELVERGCDLSAKVLRVGHHGSASASGEDFLSQVRPRYCVISCSVDNDYGHPDKATLKRLRKYTNKIFCTSTSGTVVFYSDGEGLDMRKEADLNEKTG